MTNTASASSWSNSLDAQKTVSLQTEFVISTLLFLYKLLPHVIWLLMNSFKRLLTENLHAVPKKQKSLRAEVRSNYYAFNRRLKRLRFGFHDPTTACVTYKFTHYCYSFITRNVHQTQQNYNLQPTVCCCLKRIAGFGQDSCRQRRFITW